MSGAAPRSTLKRSAVYLVCAALFAATGLAGFEYGALLWYAIPALLCLVQFVHPTRPGWAAIFALSAVATGAMVFALVRDLVGLAAGRQPSVLLDLDDSVIFLALVAVLVAVTARLLVIRPRRLAG